ncbi:sialate O-acetylesterase [Aliiruegeria sabulilitoris]|uniref:sialate O-acetylesterase n=1 Tax=Aliiruegeria sabulilitoris TaxID=1510458 RepID=UPI0008346637|nr:sialate O-acetylesterase [Aliiruegeria sabulilitoris]
MSVALFPFLPYQGGGRARGARLPVTEVFILAGQSNMIGRPAFDGGTAYPEGVLQYDMTGALIPATSPLDHHDEEAGDMGLALQFAIDYATAHPARQLVLLPAADGGTGFATGHWGVGESLYASLVSRANTLFAAHPEFRLGGILWHQGESDSTSETAANDYATELLALIEGLRSEISAADESTPFIVGDMVPDLSPTSYAFQATVRDVLSGIQALAPYTAFVAAADLTDGGDDLHFDAASLRVLGSRYFVALAAAKALTEIPTTVSILSTGFAASTVDLSEYTFTVDVGAGGTVAVGVVGRFGNGGEIATSVTLGGVSATLFDYLDNSNSQVRFAIAKGVPAGTVEITVTCSAVASRLGIHTWTIDGADATGAVSVAVNGTSASIDAPAGGAVLAIGASINPASQNIDWSGLSERIEWNDYGDTFGSGAADAVFGGAIARHAVEMATDGNFRQIALLAVPPR